MKKEIETALETTRAEEELAARRAEVQCASSSATLKQIQFYTRQRKEILRRLIKEKKEYIQLLKQKIAELE